MKSAIIYTALLLNQVGTDVNQKTMTDVLKAADSPYEIEDVIKVIDSLQGVNMKELLARGIIAPIVEAVVEEKPAVVIDDEPSGLLKLFG